MESMEFLVYGFDRFYGFYGFYGVYGESIDLSTRDPTDHPEPYIQPWDNIKITFIQNKTEKKKTAKIMQNKREDNAMHLENVKFKLCKNANAKCKMQQNAGSFKTSSGQQRMKSYLNLMQKTRNTPKL